jgi:hypothetical protein
MSSILKPIFRDMAEQCRSDPTNAVAEMRAVCDSAPGNPLMWSVTGTPGSRREMKIGQHPTIGGDGLAPCPGELVTMAIAACMDGTVRFFADLMDMRLERVRVEVVNRGDMRFLLRIPEVAEAIAQSDGQERQGGKEMLPGMGITMTVWIEAPGETPERLAQLRAAAERFSGVLNMMRNPIPIAVEWAEARSARRQEWHELAVVPSTRTVI